jgi:hypothetical protein
MVLILALDRSGLRVLPGLIDGAGQRRLAVTLHAILDEAPLYRPTTLE